MYISDIKGEASTHRKNNKYLDFFFNLHIVILEIQPLTSQFKREGLDVGRLISVLLFVLQSNSQSLRSVTLSLHL